MLSNRVYLGELHYGRETPLVKVGAHDAIVDVDLFEAVQALNEARSVGKGVAVNRAKSELAGIVEVRRLRPRPRLLDGRARRTDALLQVSGDVAAMRGPRAHSGGDARRAYVRERVLEWLGPVADELVELEVELGARGGRIVAEHRLAEAERVLVEYEADVERELEVGREAYAAGRTARVELVERRRQELAELGEADAIEVVRSTLRAAIADERRARGRRAPAALLSRARPVVVVRDSAPRSSGRGARDAPLPARVGRRRRARARRMRASSSSRRRDDRSGRPGTASLLSGGGLETEGVVEHYSSVEPFTPAPRAMLAAELDRVDDARRASPAECERRLRLQLPTTTRALSAMPTAAMRVSGRAS